MPIGGAWSCCGSMSGGCGGWYDMAIMSMSLIVSALWPAAFMEFVYESSLW